MYEDGGDLAFAEKDAFAAIEAGVGALIDAGKAACVAGRRSFDHVSHREGDGDASIPGLTIFHFDAHPDLYDEFEGNRLSHACPFARIMEAGLAKRLVQVGFAPSTGTSGSRRRNLAWKSWRCGRFRLMTSSKPTGPVYITFDMDVLDPAFAPGISHREPGGMSVREAIAHLHAIEGEIVGADLVEFNPVRDVGE